MGAFELNSSSTPRNEIHNVESSSSRRLREECIIALKIYDSCRQQDCLTFKEVGPARSAENVTFGDYNFNAGDIIYPPDIAASVTIDYIRVKKIIIVDKRPNPFKNGYWDIDLKYVFEYRLAFREADGTELGCIRSNSIFNKRLTLFGSIGSDLAFSTDLFKPLGDNTIDSEPFIMTEAKAVALSAELVTRWGHGHRPIPLDDYTGNNNGDYTGNNNGDYTGNNNGDYTGNYNGNYNGNYPGDYDERPPCLTEVHVTIGLFSIIKLFRIVNLTVESKGFCIPDECGDQISPLDPCEFFEKLDFPLDIFAPPQKPEFLAGISGNIPRHKDKCGVCIEPDIGANISKEKDKCGHR